MAAGTCNASSRAGDKGTSEAHWPACPKQAAPGSMGDCLRKQASDDTEETLISTSDLWQAHRHTHAHMRVCYALNRMVGSHTVCSPSEHCRMLHRAEGKQESRRCQWISGVPDCWTSTYLPFWGAPQARAH